jgi:NAD+ diphosphatase
MSISGKNKYIPGYLPPEESKENAWVLVFIEKKLILWKEENKFRIPKICELTMVVTNQEALNYIGKYDGHGCYCIRLDERSSLPDNLILAEMNELTGLSGDPGLFQLAGAAKHILHWSSMNQYCGCCGHKMTDKRDERAKVCPSCGNIVYPRIAPATITAVFRDGKILLAHNSNFRNGLYGLIAGYVEPGETLEQCVEREIREEVGIKVKNVRYLSSQPWPFPDSLMMGFAADYESGEITVDQCEITDADWFKADNLPDIPTVDSIAGRMIRWYRDQSANL